LDKFNLILKSSSFNIENVLVVVGGFSPKEEAVAAELGGQPREAPLMLTFFFE
jgi:hypothetical protein